MKTTAVNLTIEDHSDLSSLFGELDKNLHLIENTYGVVVSARGNRIQIEGEEKTVATVEHLIRELDTMLAQGVISKKDDVNISLNIFFYFFRINSERFWIEIGKNRYSI